MRVRRLVMLRHGQTEYNAGSRMQGQLDTELSDLGRDQAVAAAEVLAKRQPLIIVSSDLREPVEGAGNSEVVRFDELVGPSRSPGRSARILGTTFRERTAGPADAVAPCGPTGLGRP